MVRGMKSPWVPLLIATIVGGAAVALVNHQFATTFNVFVILQGAAGYAVIGFAALVVLAVRDITLAVGGIASAACVLFGWLVQDIKVPVLLAALAALLLGIAAGWVNGIIITRSGLTGFVVTLATGAAFTGLALGFTGSFEFESIPASWTNFGQGRIGIFPDIGFITVVITVLLVVLYKWAPRGRSMLATGGNPEAARLAGISTSKEIVYGHTLSGLLSACLLYTSPSPRDS